MIKIVDLRYVRLGTDDLSGAITFATDIVGLELVGRENGRAYLRGDDRDHNVCYIEGDPTDHTAGMELETVDELDDAARELEAAGVEVRRGTGEECTERRVMEFITFKDPTGNKFDLVVRPFHSGRRYFPSRDAGINEFSHIGLRTSDATRDEKFWTSLFNIQPNDWIGRVPLLSFDEVHHRLALFPSDRPGVQHVNFQVETVDDIMRSNYFLKERQIHIAFGPGRHATSGAQFLYFDGPDGVIYEYSCGVRMIQASDRPRQFPFTDSSFCVWGAKPDIAEFKS